MTATQAAAPADAPDRYRWIAMGVVLLGTFMVILDTTIVNVALPQIGKELHESSGIEWVVTAYLLAVGVAQPPTGWLADKLGRKVVFIASLVLFTLGSLFAALSPTLGVLIAARVVQGLGGGALMPVGMAMIYELFPPDRRGTALGIWGVAAMAGPAFGPVIGGYLATNVSWHWLFLINVPVGVVSVAAAVRLLRDTGYREDRAFDAVGLSLITVALVTWLYAFARAGDWTWGSSLTLGLLAVGAVLAVLFVAWERRVEHPVIDVAMFGVPIFSYTMVVIAATVVVQYGILVYLPLLLEGVWGYSALRVGVMLVPMAAAAAITFPLGGRITDRIGPRVPVVVGSIFLAVSAWILSRLTLGSSTTTIEVAIVAQGLGFGFAMMPNSVTGMNALPKRFVAQASAVRQLNVRTAASFGVAVLGSILATHLAGIDPTSAADAADAQAAYGTIFSIAAGMGVLAAVLGCFLPSPTRNRELLAERAAEHRDDAGPDEEDAARADLVLEA
ncbi:MAG TPA: DHA2 family efflux MFS transporter permease subunit [Aquihabitans sp.]|nr:DHA2 family efflux MFS transporter permease subunit [Aquihabitans sp.]